MPRNRAAWRADADEVGHRLATDRQRPPPARCYKGGQLIEVATDVWRLHNKMVDRPTGQPNEAVRHLYRHVQALRDALTEAGVSMQDHDAMAYDPGLSINVVAFQPMPELECEEVIETLRPTVYFHGRSVHFGEVIVGTPIRSPATEAAAPDGVDPERVAPDAAATESPIDAPEGRDA